MEPYNSETSNKPQTPEQRRDARDQILAVSTTLLHHVELSGGARAFVEEVRRYLVSEQLAENVSTGLARAVASEDEAFDADCEGVRQMTRELFHQAKMFGTARLVDGRAEQQAALEVVSSDLARVALFLEYHFGRLGA